MIIHHRPTALLGCGIEISAAYRNELELQEACRGLGLNSLYCAKTEKFIIVDRFTMQITEASNIAIDLHNLQSSLLNLKPDIFSRFERFANLLNLRIKGPQWILRLIYQRSLSA